MTESQFTTFVENFVRDRLLPVAETIGRIKRADSYRAAAKQSQSGASERVLVMLLDRALLGK